VSRQEGASSQSSLAPGRLARRPRRSPHSPPARWSCASARACAQGAQCCTTGSGRRRETLQAHGHAGKARTRAGRSAPRMLLTAMSLARPCSLGSVETYADAVSRVKRSSVQASPEPRGCPAGMRSWRPAPRATQAPQARRALFSCYLGSNSVYQSEICLLLVCEGQMCARTSAWSSATLSPWRTWKPMTGRASSARPLSCSSTRSCTHCCSRHACARAAGPLDRARAAAAGASSPWRAKVVCCSGRRLATSNAGPPFRAGPAPCLAARALLEQSDASSGQAAAA